MKSLYLVVAVKPRRIKTVDAGWVALPEGWVHYQACQVASSEEQAIDFAKLYAGSLPKGVTWRAEFIRDAD